MRTSNEKRINRISEIREKAILIYSCLIFLLCVTIGTQLLCVAHHWHIYRSLYAYRLSHILDKFHTCQKDIRYRNPLLVRKPLCCHCSWYLGTSLHTLKKYYKRNLVSTPITWLINYGISFIQHPRPKRDFGGSLTDDEVIDSSIDDAIVEKTRFNSLVRLKLMR